MVIFISTKSLESFCVLVYMQITIQFADLSFYLIGTMLINILMICSNNAHNNVRY